MNCVVLGNVGSNVICDHCCTSQHDATMLRWAIVVFQIEFIDQVINGARYLPCLVGNIEIIKPAQGHQTCYWVIQFGHLSHKGGFFYSVRFSTDHFSIVVLYVYWLHFGTNHTLYNGISVLQCHQCLRNGLSKSGLGDRLAAPVRELTLTMLRLLSSKVQGRTDFWKSSKPCHVGTHLICPDEYCQMSIFTYFQVFLHHLLLTKFANSIIRVKRIVVTSFCTSCRTYILLKINWILSCWYSLNRSCWILSDEYFHLFSGIFASFAIDKICHQHLKG